MRPVIRYLPFVLICAAIAGATAYAVAHSRRTYTASATVELSPTDASALLIADPGPPQPVDIGTYGAAQTPLFSSEPVLKQADALVRRSTGQSLSAFSVAGDQVGGTVTVSAKARSKTVAAASANAVISAY